MPELAAADFGLAANPVVLRAPFQKWHQSGTLQSRTAWPCVAMQSSAPEAGLRVQAGVLAVVLASAQPPLPAQSAAAQIIRVSDCDVASMRLS